MKSPNAHSSLRETYLLKFRKCSTTETLDRVFERILDKLNDEGGDINKITSLNGAYDHRRAEIYMKKNYDKILSSAASQLPARVTASVTCFPGSVSGACVAVPRSPWPRSFAPLTPLLSGCSPASPLL
uniref:Putative regulator of expression n=1 Tax=Klebsiella pneumoniae TaxID=573 RepID=A0A6G9HYC4_KLEPN|nr:putative regulator of expression [Klebsiella pneumoniae]